MDEQGKLLFKTIPLLDSQIGKGLVRDLCKSENLPESAFWDLVSAELAQVGKQQKKGLKGLIDGAFDREE